MTQLTLNAKISNIIKISLYFVNHSKELNFFKEERRHLSTQSIIERIATLKKIQNNILKMQKRSIKY
jgi:hypothetical protein